MKTDGKLMSMLTGYAASHQHPLNVFVHMIGIPTIMLGALIPLTWVTFSVSEFHCSLGHVLVVALFLFYLTLDAVFAVVFLVGGILLEMLASQLGAYPGNSGWVIAALLFFGGYAAQFIGHAVEKSMPVLVEHPVQANLAAPFFTVDELFHVIGLRDDLFRAVLDQIEVLRTADAG